MSSGHKIHYEYFGLRPSFATAAQLRDALLASYPAADFFGGPVTGVAQGHDFDTAPAWGWLKQLLRTRTDWWPAAGIAVQHAAEDGGELARQALTDLLSGCEESAVLLEWTQPLAATWPDTSTSPASRVPSGHLGDLADRQRVRLTERQSAPITIPGLAERHANNGEELAALLSTAIKHITHGPWVWLADELVVHPWARPLLPGICERIGERDPRSVRAMLDWFFDAPDLWRYEELFAAWSARPPSWWREKLKPGRGHRNPIRMELVRDATELGELARRAQYAAAFQRLTPPVIDLPAHPQLDGPPRAPFAPRGAASPAAVPPMALARGTLNDSPSSAPVPLLALAEHRAAPVQVLVVDGTRVVSVDRDRVAVTWNPEAADASARAQLPAHAITCSLSATAQGVVYVTQDGDRIEVRALDDHRLLADVEKRNLPRATIAHCQSDLGRVLLAGDGDLVLVPLAGGRVVRKTVETHEPEVLAVEPDGDAYVVRFFHVGMDMYPTDTQGTFDGSTLEERSRSRDSIDRLSPLSSPGDLSVHILGTVARVFVGERPLPDLVAHTSPICWSGWIGEMLWTADAGGTLHGWRVDRTASAHTAPAQHAGTVTHVRFTRDGTLSFSERETRLWRHDGSLAATLPAITLPVLDEQSRRLTDVASRLHAYSLTDGSILGISAVAGSHAFGRRVVGRRGLVTARVEDSHPIRILSLVPELDARRERLLPTALDAILSQGAPPIVHAGRLVLTPYLQPTRSIGLDTLGVHAEQHLHEGGTVWTALHPDGTLYSAGFRDGDVACSSVTTLVEQARWSIFTGPIVADRAIDAAVLLPRSASVVVAGNGRIRRLELDSGLVEPRDLELTERAEELVADAMEERVVVFPAVGAAQVLDVESMAWVEARDGELEAARTRRRRSPQSEAHGFAHAFVCGEGRYLVGWSFGLSITALPGDARTLRGRFSTLIAPKSDTLAGSLLDDTREELWLLCHDGKLARASLSREGPFEVVTTIPEGAGLSWASGTTFAVHTTSGTLHVLRTDGEVVSRIEGFLPSLSAPYALSESVVICSERGGRLRVSAIPGDSYFTLDDPRATVEAGSIAIASPFVAARHGNRVLCWDLRTRACVGAWTAATTLTSIDVRADGAVLVGEADGTVTLVRPP